MLFYIVDSVWACQLPVVQMCYQCVFCLISVWCQFTGKPVSLLFNYGGPDVPLEPLSTNKITARPPKHPEKKMCKFIGPNMFRLRPIYSGFCSDTVSRVTRFHTHCELHVYHCTSLAAKDVRLSLKDLFFSQLKSAFGFVLFWSIPWSHATTVYMYVLQPVFNISMPIEMFL